MSEQRRSGVAFKVAVVTIVIAAATGIWLARNVPLPKPPPIEAPLDLGRD